MLSRQRDTMRLGVLLIALVVVVGCTETVTVSPVATCVEQPFRASLQVDAHDARQVWATDYETGRDVAVRPRAPGSFTFDRTRPTLLLDGEGHVLSFTGEISQSGCYDAGSQTVFLGADDLPDPNRPPN